MSDVPLYKLLLDTPAVAALLGGVHPIRVYAFGQAPQKVVRPYLVWQEVTGSPGNNLSDLPDHDLHSIQVDIYALNAVDCDNVRRAVRDAIEPVMHIVSWYGDSRDPATDDYRTTFAVDWFVPR